MEMQETKSILLFDVDGTLTAPRKKVSAHVMTFLEAISKKINIAIVGGSDLEKIKEQLLLTDENISKIFSYIFSENGLLCLKEGKEFYRGSIQEHFGEELLQKFINRVLCYLSQLSLPVKRGTFVEFRNGMINVCPVGRSCTQEERDAFGIYDKEHRVRETMVKCLEEEFSEFGFTFVIGGQISFDVFPKGWDKRFCLQFIEAAGYDVIHFFGDKTAPGGNDHAIFEDTRTHGYTVTSAEDTIAQVSTLLNLSEKF